MATRRLRRPASEWRSPSLVDISNTSMSFARPQGGTKDFARPKGRKRASSDAAAADIAPVAKRVRKSSARGRAAGCAQRERRPSERCAALGAPLSPTIPVPRQARRVQKQPAVEALRFKAGDAVTARYAADGENYDATIARVYRASARYLIDWSDGDPEHRFVPSASVSPRQASPKWHRRKAQPKTAPVSPATRPPPALTEWRALAASARRAREASRAAIEDKKNKKQENEEKKKKQKKRPEEVEAPTAERWDDTRMAQLGAEVKSMAVSSASYWPQVATHMQRKHGMHDATAAECQQTYSARFPTPVRKRRSSTRNKAQLQPSALAPLPPKPGTIGWKAHVRAVLAAGDTNHIDDLFEPSVTDQQPKLLRRPTAASAGRAALLHPKNDEPSDDDEESPEFWPATGAASAGSAAVSEKEQREMDSYLARLQRCSGKTGALFRGGGAKNAKSRAAAVAAAAAAAAPPSADYDPTTE